MTWLCRHRSVASCEVAIQQLYSLLGWDYRDEDSEAEDELQRKPPVLGRNDVAGTSASRRDADGEPMECGEEMSTFTFRNITQNGTAVLLNISTAVIRS